MGYKDKDNNGIFVKVRGAHDKDDEGEQAQDPATLGQIMGWERFSLVLVILTHDSTAWTSVLTRWVLKLQKLIAK